MAILSIIVVVLAVWLRVASLNEYANNHKKLSTNKKEIL